MEPIKVLTKNVGKPNSASIDTYISGGGYESLKKALKSTPDELVQLVKDSEMRGRGGAGFPTGMKWSFLPKDSTKPRYLLCNADESEPGTFKDRVIIEHDPHLLGPSGRRQDLAGQVDRARHEPHVRAPVARRGA